MDKIRGVGNAENFVTIRKKRDQRVGKKKEINPIEMKEEDARKKNKQGKEENTEFELDAMKIFERKVKLKRMPPGLEEKKEDEKKEDEETRKVNIRMMYQIIMRKNNEIRREWKKRQENMEKA